MEGILQEMHGLAQRRRKIMKLTLHMLIDHKKKHRVRIVPPQSFETCYPAPAVKVLSRSNTLQTLKTSDHDHYIKFCYIDVEDDCTIGDLKQNIYQHYQEHHPSNCNL